MKRFRPWVWVPAAAYGVVGCVWPLLSRHRFRAVTGPKTDRWLMDTVALELGVTASVMARADLNDRLTPEIAGTMIGSSLAMAGLTITNVARGRIPGTNIVIAGGHLGLVAFFVTGLRRHGGSHIDPAPARGLNVLVWGGQAAYFALGSLWPIFGSRSFQQVTGPKRDMWLAQGVALLLGVQGAAIVSAGIHDRVTPEIAQLGAGSSLALATVGVVNALRGRISKVYLLDAATHAALVAGWWLAQPET